MTGFFDDALDAGEIAPAGNAAAQARRETVNATAYGDAPSGYGIGPGYRSPPPSGGWKPIATAPHGRWIEVCGDSRYVPMPLFLAIARYDPKRYQDKGAWIDVQYYNLNERGWEPMFWRPMGEFPKVRQ